MSEPIGPLTVRAEPGDDVPLISSEIAAATAKPFYGDCGLCAASNSRGMTFMLWTGDSEDEVRGLVQAHIEKEHGTDFARVWANPDAAAPGRAPG